MANPRAGDPADELGEAERQVRELALIPGYTYASQIRRLLVEYDRRGQIEQRLTVAAGLDVDTADWRACVRYIAGDDWAATPTHTEETSDER